MPRRDEWYAWTLTNSTHNQVSTISVCDSCVSEQECWRVKCITQ
jgi:hypothetical protein